MTSHDASLHLGVLALQGAFIEHVQCLQRLAPLLLADKGIDLRVTEVRTAKDLRVNSNVASAVSSESGSADSPRLLDGLIIPGGESTAMLRLLKDDSTGLTSQLQQWISAGRPVFGTCAGSILLSNRVVPATPEPSDSPADPSTDRFARSPDVLLGGMRMNIARNWYGRQLASFECSDLVLAAALEASGAQAPAIFIRAPAIVDVDVGAAGVEVLATLPSQEQHRRNAASSLPIGTAADLHAVAVRDGALLATCFHPELSNDLRWHRYFVNMCIERQQQAHSAPSNAS